MARELPLQAQARGQRSRTRSCPRFHPQHCRCASSAVCQPQLQARGQRSRMRSCSAQSGSWLSWRCWVLGAPRRPTLKPWRQVFPLPGLSWPLQLVAHWSVVCGQPRKLWGACTSPLLAYCTPFFFLLTPGDVRRLSRRGAVPGAALSPTPAPSVSALPGAAVVMTASCDGPRPGAAMCAGQLTWCASYSYCNQARRLVAFFSR